MEEVVNQLSGNPLFAVLVGLLIFIVAFFVLKSLFRIILFLAVLITLYLGYIYFLQEKYPLPGIDPEKLTEFQEKVVGLLPDNFGVDFFDSNYSRSAEKP